MIHKKTLIAILLIIMANAPVKGQLNPVKNLYFEINYDFENNYCPSYNCFLLSWENPENSTDILNGFQICKNNEKWIFTESVQISCTGVYYPCEYPDFFDNMPFWLTVKAVYNSDSVLSIATDSIWVDEIYMTVDDFNVKNIRLVNNPVAKNQNISILIPNPEPLWYQIAIFSTNGQIIRTQKFSQLSETIINISSQGLVPGMYYLMVLSDVEKASFTLLIK